MRKSRAILLIGSIVTILCVIGIVYLVMSDDIGKGATGKQAASSQLKDEREKEPFLTEKEKDEKETYLFIGTDASGNENAAGEDYRGSMADVLMLVIVNKTQKTYATLQLNRDTMTEISLMQTDGSKMASATLQLCTAHWYGGTKEQSCENTVEAVSKLLNEIPIDGYYALSMEEIPVLNRAVGGVTVTVESDFSKVDKSLKKGETITLSDEQAYVFLHDRYEVDDEKNISRMKRQKQYLEAFIQKVKEKSKEDKKFLTKFWKELSDKAVTNISGKKFSKLANTLVKSTSKGIYTLEGKEKSGKALGDGIEHTEFIVDKKSLRKIMSEIYG